MQHSEAHTDRPGFDYQMFALELDGSDSASRGHLFNRFENNSAQRQALCNFCTGEGASGEFEMYRTTFRVNRDF